MSDEQPVEIKKRKKSECLNRSDVCIVHYDRYNSDTDIKSLTEANYEKIKLLSSVRQSHHDPTVRLDHICNNLPQQFTDNFYGQHVTSTPVQDLFSSQEEADTRIIFHCLHAAKTSSEDKNIIIRSPDTDVFLLLVAYCHNIGQRVLFDTGVGNKRRLLIVQEVSAALGSEVLNGLLGLHSFTGCDTTSAFVRKGKVSPLKVLDRNPECFPMFHEMGSTPDVITETMLNAAEHFVCCMYGHPSYNDVNMLRFEIFKSRFESNTTNDKVSFADGIDFSLIPPCRESLRMHVQRANYQTYIWKNSHIGYVTLPSPVGLGWMLDDSRKLVIEWTHGDLMPQNLVDILSTDKVIEETDDVEVHSEDVEEDYEVDNIIDIIFENDE